MNPVKDLFQRMQWNDVQAAKNLRMHHENVRRIIKGLPSELPDSFQLRLLRYMDMSLEAVDALNASYVDWRNGESQSAS